MDLFTPLVKYEALHPLFKIIVNEKAYQPTMQVINEWADGVLQRARESTKFVKEFQTTFNSSLWEAYLNRAFRDMGYEIDYSKKSPDFHLMHDSGRRINVEAVTTNSRYNTDPSYYNLDSFQNSISNLGTESLNQSVIRLIGKIKDKRNLFKGEAGKRHPYSSLDHVKSNPFVVAIAPFDNHLSYHQNNMAINMALYGLHPPDRNGNQDAVEHILNHNHQKIDVGIFTNSTYKEISAVIFSTTGTFGKAVTQTNFKGFVRATRYRQMSVEEFLKTEGMLALGKSNFQVDNGYDIYRLRFFDGLNISGSDMHLCPSKNYKESHLDGLHIYYNPYAEVPLSKDLFIAPEITQNDYDTKSKIMLCDHNDGSLVSRQVFSSL